MVEQLLFLIFRAIIFSKLLIQHIFVKLAVYELFFLSIFVVSFSIILILSIYQIFTII